MPLFLYSEAEEAQARLTEATEKLDAREACCRELEGKLSLLQRKSENALGEERLKVNLVSEFPIHAVLLICMFSHHAAQNMCICILEIYKFILRALIPSLFCCTCREWFPAEGIDTSQGEGGRCGSRETGGRHGSPGMAISCVPTLPRCRA